MDTTQVRKLKDLEKENLRLKNVVANSSLNNAILKERRALLDRRLRD
jgi:hypothetical protein